MCPSLTFSFRLLELEMLLAVLEIDAAEGSRHLGAEVAAVDSKDARVVSHFPISTFHLLNAREGAAHVGQRYQVAAVDGGVKIAFFLEDSGAVGDSHTTFERRLSRDRDDQAGVVTTAGAAGATTAVDLRGAEGYHLVTVGQGIPRVAAHRRGPVGGLAHGSTVLDAADGNNDAAVEVYFLALLCEGRALMRPSGDAPWRLEPQYK